MLLGQVKLGDLRLGRGEEMNLLRELCGLLVILSVSSSALPDPSDDEGFPSA